MVVAHSPHPPSCERRNDPILKRRDRLLPANCSGNVKGLAPFASNAGRLVLVLPFLESKHIAEKRDLEEFTQAAGRFLWVR